MKKLLYRMFPAMFLLSLPAGALAAETSVDSVSMLRFRQEATGFEKGTFIPFTQFLGVDVDKLGDGNLSLHLYGWGRLDLADRINQVDNSDSSIDGSLTYGYLQYRFNVANAHARAGRFSFNEGIIHEQVDGVSARTDLPYGFGISAFGGAPVHTISRPSVGTDGKGDGIFGGRFNYRWNGRFELGVSGVYETDAPTTSTTDPRFYGSHRLVGGDLFISPVSMFQISGRTSYDAETGNFAEHSYQFLVRPTDTLVVAATFDKQNYRDLFFSSILFTSPDFLNRLGEKNRAYGLSAVYNLNKNADLSGDFKYYNRDIGDADRFGGDLRLNFPEKSVRAGAGYHYLRASSVFAVLPIPSNSGSYHELRGWAMRDTSTYFASFDLINQIFKKEVEGKDAAWQGTATVGYHLSPDFSLSGDLTYGQNAQYNDELKGLIRLTYNKSTGKGGLK